MIVGALGLAALTVGAFIIGQADDLPSVCAGAFIALCGFKLLGVQGVWVKLEGVVGTRSRCPISILLPVAELVTMNAVPRTPVVDGGARWQRTQ